MEQRRYVMNSSAGSYQQSASTSHLVHHSRTSNSFIPTSGVQRHAHSTSHLQSNGGALQANYYQNLPSGNNTSNHSRLEYQHQQQHHFQQQQQHQRTLTKSSYNHQQNNASHYGTIGVTNNNSNNNSGGNNVASNNHNAFYGNSTIVMNGGSGSNNNNVTVQPIGHHHQIPHNSYNQMHYQQQQHNNSSIPPPQTHFMDPRESLYQPEAELPQTLVDSMRTLFDILDDNKQGKISFQEISSRWETESNGANGKGTGAEPLIKMGVLGYLKKVTPHDGMLTFDRFCAGLRLALLTNNNNPILQNQNMSFSIPHPQQQQQNPIVPDVVSNERYPVNSSSSQQFQNTTNTTTSSSHTIQTQTHQTFQQQVRNMANNFHKSHNSSSNLPNGNVISSNNSNKQQVQQSNTIQRINGGTNQGNGAGSKIPSLSSTSRLPTSNSGIPVSPNRSFASASAANTNLKKQQFMSNNQHEHGTTVAMIHNHQQPPPPNSKSGTLLKRQQQNRQQSNLPNTTRYNKNGSLDNLKTTDEEKLKDRPPSAPLLDINTDNGGYSQSRRDVGEEREKRAKSHDRDHRSYNQQQSNKATANNSVDDGKKVNFVSPRQRTLSMPQLQMGKLKPKSIQLDETTTNNNSPTNTTTSSPTKTNVVRTIASKLHSKMNGQLMSSIPSISKSKLPTVASQNTSVLDTNQSPSKISPPYIIVNDHNVPGDKEIHPPPKPPRNAVHNGLVTFAATTLTNNPMMPEPPSVTTTSGSSVGSNSNGNSPSKPEVRSILHTWQKGIADKKPVEQTLSVASVNNNSTVNTLTTTNANTNVIVPPEKPVLSAAAVGNELKHRANAKTNIKRRETPVQSGIDFATLKRLKQLEQERDVLQQGIAFLEQGKEWYEKQLQVADEKIRMGAPTDYWSESNEERLNLLGCRISEVNNLIKALMDGSAIAAPPNHMNLQIIPSHLSLRTIVRLKEQNRQLTQEVSDHSHRVTQLEAEKSALLRQLFHQQKNSNHQHHDETVYM